MTPLTKQLEDKKKGCGKTDEYNETCEKNTTDRKSGNIFYLCPIGKAEIAILKQAISEMQKQRQDFERILNGIIGKLEDGRNQKQEIINYCKNKKQQLNQPKEEKKDA